MNQVLNFGATTIATATLASGDLTLTLTSTALLSGAKPSAVVPTTAAPVVAVMFRQAYTNAVSAAINNAAEVVHITHAAGTGMTIVRAQEGSTAISFVAGDYFTCPITAGIIQEIDTLKAPLAAPALTGNVSVTGGGALTVGTTSITGMAAGDIKADRGAGQGGVFLGSSGGILYNDGTKYNFGTTEPGQLPVAAIGGFQGNVTGNVTGDVTGNINGVVTGTAGSTLAGVVTGTLFGDLKAGDENFVVVGGTTQATSTVFARLSSMNGATSLPSGHLITMDWDAGTSHLNFYVDTNLVGFVHL